MKKHIIEISKELKKNKGFRTKLSLICYRIGFLENYIIKRKILKIILNILYKVLKLFTFVFSTGDIPPKGCYIDYGIRVPYGFQGIFINENAKIGKNVTIFQNVTLGAIEKTPYKANIIIGNDVYIGCGCIILGNTQIGNNVRIGAGTKIINKNIPDNKTVVNKYELTII
ncbi:serine O-acetyltransferase [Caproiciproducens sp. MSJ-32]|uniref:serine O-acetyltransferase n=1 Tax=Caproiciproducens sp. MSJ-32 TaxID=2841527 RepID=UPI001C10E910|nr:serine acetyltransferase [Caproiciproducens sp. MSJ-32]MBU5455556.1 serine acetyltransferase [Caproiciproducens sp. MSJ-32]